MINTRFLVSDFRSNVSSYKRKKKAEVAEGRSGQGGLGGGE